MRAVVELELPVALERSSARPLQRQLADALRAAALDGRLSAGTRLPSSRHLAAQLAVARSTVVAAYDQLVGEGYLEAGHGSGTFLTPGITAAPAPRPVDAPPRARTVKPPRVVDLRPGHPDTSRLVDPAWRAAWRTAASGPIPSGEPPRQGLEELRVQIAEHLRAARGISAEPDDVFITAGASEALMLIVDALELSGRSVAVEDPGYPSARRALTRLGCALHPIAVDAGGLRVKDLPPAPAPVAAVLVTPSHQYPLGATMGIERRQALLEYARRRATVVIEDDYDSEFRYGAPPLPALAALERDLVVHVGTFSKTLTPWLRLGFVLVPPRWRGAFAQTRADLTSPVSGIDQQALASYMATGALRRHIARVRRDYRHRREHLHHLLAAQPELTSTDTRAGLHAVIRLPPATDVPHLLAQLNQRGISLADLGDYPLQAPAPYPGLVLGFGDASTSELTHAITAVHHLLAPSRDATDQPAPPT